VIPLLRGHEFYVRVGGAGVPEQMSACVGDAPCHREASNPFCVVFHHDFHPPEAVLADLAEVLDTEVIWLAWQKQADSFAFQRWHQGKSVRRLSYGVDEERIWELVDGVPEQWEADAFFPAASLERQIRVKRMLGSESEADLAELQRIWSHRLLRAGAEDPVIVAISCAHVVARHYRLPGWGA
jgi:hypothetical protein